MRGVFLPGHRRVVVRDDLPAPVPGPGQLLVRVRASTICGSDIRAIYVEHKGVGAEAYQGVVAGHEPCGEVAAVGPGCAGWAVGERVVVYHIAGCGRCGECRTGYQIGCTAPERAAYGWQRDGGHAEFLLAEQASCVRLPDSLSYLDGACVACGFGTAYEGLRRAGVSGRDGVLVTGLGPVGLAVGMLARALGAAPVIGTDFVPERRALALGVGAVDHVLEPGNGLPATVRELCPPGVSVAVDASGSPPGRLAALECLARWGRCVFLGEGGELTVDVSRQLIHRQVTVYGSWVTSIGHMAELLELLARWDLHPEKTVTHRFPLDQAAQAYRVAEGRGAGKVAILP
ncbi:MAG: zinc-dependent alcohol dehydrogenase family protein [Micromonosporaceae bacterium]